MFRKICNYFAVISLSLIVGGSALANPKTLSNPAETKEVVVDVDKGSSFYNEFLVSGGKHAYTVKVEAGKQVKIRIHSSRAASLKIQTPNGETKSYSQDKYFDINLLSEGEYVVELSSLFISQYSVEVFNR